jgi:hypothetical protein
MRPTSSEQTVDTLRIAGISFRVAGVSAQIAIPDPSRGSKLARPSPIFNLAGLQLSPCIRDIGKCGARAQRARLKATISQAAAVAGQRLVGCLAQDSGQVRERPGTI